MEKVIFFIDGFNLYHSLANKRFNKYKWLDLKTLIEKFITKKENIEKILYFTALTTWSQNKMNRHKVYIKALELQGIEIIYGEFRRVDKKCPLCHKMYSTFEEKRTDVNIAIHLFRLAIQDKFDKAYILCADSDLIPPIEAVKKLFPHKQIGILIPIHRPAELLKHICDFHMKIKEKHLINSLLPEIIPLKDGKKLIRPKLWY
ncbi:MAG: NYN domain-containing protein [Bacteroidales bacterium]